MRKRAQAAGLLDRIPPGATELHDLGAVHAAGAGEGDYLGLGFAPTGKRGGPLAGAAEGEDLATGQDDAAINLARHERREFAGHDRDHRLVEQREPGQPALAATNRALLVQRAGEKIGVVESAHRPGRIGRRGERLRSRLRQAFFDDRHQEIAAFDTVGG